MLSNVTSASREIWYHFLPMRVGWTTRQTWLTYFNVDLTLQELRSLRVKQRFPFRDSYYDGQFEIAILEEYILVGQAADRLIDIYPETKDAELPGQCETSGDLFWKDRGWYVHK